MKNLIPLLRQDRLREIKEYKARGYIFRNGENKYFYVRNITVSNKEIQDDLKTPDNEVTYSFQVRVDQDERRFYILNKSTMQSDNCIYLTIYEIYQLLIEISRLITPQKIVATLLGGRTNKRYINYTDLQFEVSFFDDDFEPCEVSIPGSNIMISYENLLILIALIQDKSNYLWSDNEEKSLYIDGLLRLLCCLISTQDNEELKNHGWLYDPDLALYKVTDANNKEKYYLTPDQYQNIMEV